MTVIIFILGTGFFLIFEYNHSLKNLSFVDKLLSATYYSTVGRTAGFTVGPWEQATNLSHALMIVLMFIGGAPTSVCGGIKITAVFVVSVALKNLFTNKPMLIYKRTIPKFLLLRIFGLIVLSCIIVFMGTVILMSSENLAFLPCLFETVSAFGTCGLSIGVTGEVHGFGKCILIMLMLIGRIGPALYSMITDGLTTIEGGNRPTADIFLG